MLGVMNEITSIVSTFDSDDGTGTDDDDMCALRYGLT